MNHTLVCGLLAALALSAGCRSTAGDTGAESQIEVSMAVSVAPVTVAPMTKQVRLVGKTVAMRDLMIRSPVAGRVLGLTVQVGDQVRRGQVIAHVLTREDEAAEAGAQIAGQMQHDSAVPIAEAVKRYTNQNGIPVVAPEAAIVAQRTVTANQFVNEFDPIVDLIDPGSIYVEAGVPFNVLGEISPGMPAVVTSAFQPGKELPARVAAVLPAASLNAGTVPVRIDFTSPQRLQKAGASVDVMVVVAQSPNALVIPATAVFEDPEQNSYHVFVVGADHKAHRTTIKIGLRNAQRAEVTAGLAAGQRVITSGGYALSDGLMVRPIETPQS